MKDIYISDLKTNQEFISYFIVKISGSEGGLQQEGVS